MEGGREAGWAEEVSCTHTGKQSTTDQAMVVILPQINRNPWWGLSTWEGSQLHFQKLLVAMQRRLASGGQRWARGGDRRRGGGGAGGWRRGPGGHKRRLRAVEQVRTRHCGQQQRDLGDGTEGHSGCTAPAQAARVLGPGPQGWKLLGGHVPFSSHGSPELSTPYWKAAGALRFSAPASTLAYRLLREHLVPNCLYPQP